MYVLYIPIGLGIYICSIIRIHAHMHHVTASGEYRVSLLSKQTGCAPLQAAATGDESERSEEYVTRGTVYPAPARALECSPQALASDKRGGRQPTVRRQRPYPTWLRNPEGERARESARAREAGLKLPSGTSAAAQDYDTAFRSATGSSPPLR